MLRICQILVRPLIWPIVLAGSMVSLAACGQRGALYLPADTPGVQRATLPQTLRPGTSTATPPAPTSSSPSSSPTATPSQ